jgi:regulator of RNase E activity RraA
LAKEYVMNPWQSDEGLFALARRELFTAVVGDVMDTMGLRHQFLPPKIRPLSDEMVLIGRAMPVLETDVFADGRPDADDPLARPFGLMFRALDDLRPGEVYICTGASSRYALWGELMSVRAIHCGAAGAVLDGYARDTRAIRRLGFPTFCHGPYAQDQAPRGKVMDFRVPIEVEGVRVEPGDIIFGDLDGICVVPALAVDEAFRRAREKVQGEQLVRESLKAGHSATDVFQTLGIM